MGYYSTLTTRPAFTQFLNLEIRRSANFVYFRNVVGRILNLKRRGRVGRGLLYRFGSMMLAMDSYC